MFIGTTTATVIKDGILSILIVLSEIAFRWWPATLAVITGTDAPDSTPVADAIIESLTDGQSQPSGYGAQGGSVSSPDTATGVIVYGTYYGEGGVVEQLPQEGGVRQGSTEYQTSVEQEGSQGGFALETLSTAWGIFAPISIFISLIIATAIIYSLIRYMQVKAGEKRALALAEQATSPAPAASAVRVAGVALPGADVVMPSAPSQAVSAAERRWSRIQEQVASDDENDWRLAILDADIMLDEVLETVGFPGATLGEKLKAARAGEGGKFATLDSAWDAHIIRNHLAHRGSGYQLTHREAKKAISQFGEVFREFGLVE